MFYSDNLLLIFRGGSRAAATSKMLQQLHLGCCSSPRSASDLLFRCSTDDLFYDLKKNILEEHFQDRLRNLLLKVMINTYGKNAAEVSFTIGNFLGHLLYFYHHMLHFFQILFKNFSAFNFLAEGFSRNQFYWAFLLGGFFPGDFFPGFFFEDIFLTFLNTFERLLLNESFFFPFSLYECFCWWWGFAWVDDFFINYFFHTFA